MDAYQLLIALLILILGCVGPKVKWPDERGE